MTVRNPLVLIPGGNPQIQELPAGDSIGGAPQGPAGEITIGTVTTGAAGSSASVTNSGTTTSAILDFTIPKGDKGDKGDAGTGGNLETIARVITTGSQSTITFSAIPGTYTDLRIILTGRDTATGSSDVSTTLQLNGDTTSGNYTNTEFFQSSGTGTLSATSTGGSIGNIPGSSGYANAAGMCDVVIPNYAGTVFHKFVRSNFATISVSNIYVGQRMFVWKSTAAITSIVITAGATAFVNGTTATLYGLN